MIEVDRYDKALDPRAAEIQKDWRAWVLNNGFEQTKTILVHFNGDETTLELWEKKEDHFLFLPPITVVGDGKIFILDPNRVEGMIEEVKTLAQVALIMVQGKRDARLQTHKAMNKPSD